MPEIEIRFLDCLKLMRRSQMQQASTLLGAVTSVIAKKGDKTFFEEVINDIIMINQSINEIDMPPEDTRTKEEKDISLKEKREAAKKRHERFLDLKGKGELDRRRL